MLLSIPFIIPCVFHGVLSEYSTLVFVLVLYAKVYLLSISFTLVKVIFKYTLVLAGTVTELPLIVLLLLPSSCISIL